MDRSAQMKNSLSRVNTVLDSLLNKLGLDKRLRERCLMDLWPSLVGDFFDQRTRPLFIDSENQLVVAVKDASVGQELSLRKRDILLRLKACAQGLNLVVKGLRFDMKAYYQVAPKSELQFTAEPTLPEPEQNDLDQVALTQDELGRIAELRGSLVKRGIDVNLSQRMVSLYENKIRLRSWQKSNGYPICPLCNSTSTHLHGSSRLCSSCFLEEINAKKSGSKSTSHLDNYI